MHRQLAAIAADLESATGRLHALCATVPRFAWHARPAPARWSPAECVAHLNLTSATLLPLLRRGLDDARARSDRAGSRYRRDPVGWLVSKAVSPGSALKTTTIAELAPDGYRSRESLVKEFERLQHEVIGCVREADGLPIDRVMLASPFSTALRYNLYAGLTIVARHQHRHLRQAEQAAEVCAAFVSAPAV